MMPRVIDRMLGGRRPDADRGAGAIACSTRRHNDPAALQKCLAALDRQAARIARSPAEQLAAVAAASSNRWCAKILAGPADDPLYRRRGAAGDHLAATLRRIDVAREAVRLAGSAAERAAAGARRAGRRRATPSLETVDRRAAGRPDSESGRAAHRGARIAGTAGRALGGAASCWPTIERFEPELRPKAIELLTERRAWAEQLLDAIGRRRDSRRGAERQPGAAICSPAATRRWPRKSRPTGARCAPTAIRSARKSSPRCARSCGARRATRRPARKSSNASAASATSCYGEGQDVGPGHHASTAAVRSSSCCRTCSIPAW